MVIRLEECASTQEEARGRAPGTVVVARRQTAGRGRQGREWLSVGEALTFSMVVRPAAHLERLTLTAGAAVLAALDELGVRCQLKWPNDIYHDGRKLGGILVEAREGTAILGLGLNVAGFPADLPATDLASLGYTEGSEPLLQVLLRHLPGDVEAWDETLRVARSRSATLGRHVTTSQGEVGRAVEIDSDGSLILETPEGSKKVFSGEIDHISSS